VVRHPTGAHPACLADRPGERDGPVSEPLRHLCDRVVARVSDRGVERASANPSGRRMTIRRILVPLDGSRLAEAVLPAAASLAKALRACVLLLHVLERDPPRSVHGEPHLTSASEANEYLDGVASRLRRQGIEVEAD